MKSFSGHAEGVGRTAIPAMVQLLRAVDDYPRWHPEGVPRVVVLERDPAGSPLTLEATLRVAVGPIARDVELTLAVSAPDARRVTLTRLPNEPEDPERFVARWYLDRAEPEGTSVRLELEAELDLPRLVPVGDLANHLARAFVQAAIAAVEA